MKLLMQQHTARYIISKDKMSSAIHTNKPFNISSIIGDSQILLLSNCLVVGHKTTERRGQ